MPTEPQPPSVAEVVRRALEACDPSGGDAVLGALLERFEDADEPVTAVDDLESLLADAAAETDPEVEDPAVSMAIATVLYLAHRRDMLDGDDEDVLRLAARAEWRGDPPAAVVAWLADRGVEV
ncbi:MAG TPA: hypothetical protein VFU94_12585 [Conexibacter sp.]|nr:hypothetical protein [Conexibacter sp.]